MKTIFVPVGGTADDRVVFETAHAAARLLCAHLAFCHIRIGAGEAALWTPHADFARGAGLRATLRRLTEEAEFRGVAAERHVTALCSGRGIAMTGTPSGSRSGTAGVSASWRGESGDALHRLMFHARHHDLVVLGRARGPNGLPPDFIEQLVLGCGRPLLIASKQAPAALAGTVLMCWKETAEAARAVSAALPLLSRAGRVVVATVEEDDRNAASGLAELARLMTWHGITAETELLSRDRRPVQEQLADVARRHRADLMVMGGYGRSRARELILGGVTQSVIESAELPVFLLH